MLVECLCESRDLCVAGEGQCYAVKDPRHGGYCQSSGGNCGTD